MQEPEPNQRKVDLIEVVGGAFAAVSAAFVASTLGVAGTLLGAAVMSVVAAIGGALYTRSLEQAHARVRTRRTPPTGEPAPADRPPPTPRSIPWGRVAAMAGLVFVLALGAITALELTADDSFAALVQRSAAEQPATPAAEQAKTTLGRVLRPTKQADEDSPSEPTERDQAPASPASAPTEEEPTDKRERERTPKATAEPEREATAEPEREAPTEPEPTPEPKDKPTPAPPDAPEDNQQP